MNDAHIRPSYELPTSDLGGLSMAGHVQRIEAINAWVNSKGTGSFPAFDEEHEVLKIVRAGKKIEFSFSELKLAAAQLDESETERLRGDRKTFMSEMMARLYMQRFRYEDE